METKKEIRSCILKQRRAQSKETCEKSSMVIAQKLLALPEYRKAKNIYAYMNFSGEVKTEMILKESLRLGKNLWLPRVNGDIMDFFRVRSKDDFEIGAYGILEPKGESKAGKEEARDGFMVVPGVAFDADRNRIGFGGGYYDKYLELYPELFTAAVAFGFQIVEGVPTEANDIRPQKLITEERIYE
ncbi:5-formyltetrahydrofolate cyclo-ligase [Dorea sp. AM13-35]|uniref:5-formyltetrahydrofolate cyclo-ligase n=1 Tax=Dorea sp. AM13-35 TaxID=2293099 RepID=UPI001FAAA12C|nr:5-formyltetrahydrofolate cyclo-ligase [Dorea sp. AM13-35]